MAVHARYRHAVLVADALLWLVADPTYTVSGARDHYRQQSSGGFLIEKVPEHANLFSELQQYPATSFRCDTGESWQLIHQQHYVCTNSCKAQFKRTTRDVDCSHT